ncbi:MAG: hypothetical protein ACLSE4_09800 [Clostridium sp.]
MIGFKMAVDGILRGAGAVKVFTIANLVNLGLRVLIAKLGAPVYGIAMIWYAVPLGWLANFPDLLRILPDREMETDIIGMNTGKPPGHHGPPGFFS